MGFVFSFWLLAFKTIHLESYLMFLIEHFDKGARHQALHQTLLTVHVILIYR